MIELIKRLLGTKQGSSQDAKTRLKFLLVHDEVDISPAQLDKMKLEILEVIRRYVEVDTDGVEFKLDKAEGQIALVSSMPVRKVTARHRPATA